MLRMFVCATLTLLFAANLSLAADKNNKKKGTTLAGTVKSIDAAAGKLTLTVKKKKVQEDKDFTVGNSVKVITITGDEKKELTGKDGLKGIKIGDKIRVRTDEGGNVLSIQTGDLPKKKNKVKTAK
jgi:Cu/Ag efflux protein CusF